MPSMTEAVPVTSSMTSPMILADGIRKRFGANEVLKGVSLTLAKGEVVKSRCTMPRAARSRSFMAST